MTTPGHVPPPPDQFGPVVITAREIYDAVIRVSAKVDTVALQQTYAEQERTDLQRRVTSLERMRWPLPSVAALCGIAAVVIAIVPHK